MSSTTTNLGLTKPAYTDDADVAIINSNMDIIDTAYGSINQSTLRDVPFAVAVSDWSAVTGGFSATFNTAYITASSKEILTYDGSLASYAKAHILAAKKSGGGGLVFTTATKPTGTITGNVYVFDNDDNKLPVLIEDTVTPIANGGTGQSSLAGAQQALGITALNNQIENDYAPCVDEFVYKSTSSFQDNVEAGQSKQITLTKKGIYRLYIQTNTSNSTGQSVTIQQNNTTIVAMRTNGIQYQNEQVFVPIKAGVTLTVNAPAGSAVQYQIQRYTD